MSTSRHFLLAQSLARLIQKERGGERICEGYFSSHSGRTAYVELDGRGGRLILITDGTDGPIEDRAEVPLAHAAALLDVTAAAVEYFRIEIVSGACQIQIKRMFNPGPLDLIAVAFEDVEEAHAFEPPLWFGPEVTSVPNYWTQTVALTGVPNPVEVPLSDAALMSLLDALENRAPAAKSPGRFSGITKVASRPPAHPPGTEPALFAPVRHETTIKDVEESLIRELARSLHPQRP
ncbi:CYTH domain-containing protein [Microvirga alba]|uniref:CYTH domain-containing protein n=1 Tax=Microvirga alba TaxID=2791025 RepID=A0A931FU31_9HYPH|nr:hypothetical protein [Microvirga alba]MBF9235236.1 hypothetical protein [Microvirga alba]